MDTLPRILQGHLERDPERIAIHLLLDGGVQPIRYRDLLLGAAGYAQALQAAGVRPGQVVVLIQQHGPGLIYAFFGAVLARAIPAIMPFLTEKLQPERYRQSLRALLRVSRPAAVVTYQQFLPELRLALQGSSVRALQQEAMGRAAELDLAALQGMEADPQEVVLLQHSSGTTGLQKGVALSHRAVLNQVRNYAAAIRMSPRDVVVSWLPLYHDMGLIAGFVMPILLGAPLVLMSPFDWVRAPHKLLRAVSDYRGTLTWLPNFAYNFCARKIRPSDLEGIDLSSWRAVINCSEPMRWESHQRFRERFEPYGLRPAALATCYAMAENVFAVTQGGIGEPVAVDPIDRRALARGEARPASGPQALRMLSAGRPISNTRVRVVDAQGRDLPERAVGEIALRSDCMLSGYFNRPDLTEKAFQRGWYRTGDLGYLADGQLYVTGRRKEIIIVGGKNVYPQDLEELAMEVEGVHPGRVVAFGLYNEALGTEEVVIVAEADTDDPAERRRIADQIRQRVNQGSEVTARYVLVVERKWLVKTSSGKVGRNLNREKYLKQFGRSRRAAREG